MTGLSIGDLVIHKKKAHLGTGRVRRMTLVFDTETSGSTEDECVVLVQWEHGIAPALDDPIRWRGTGGAEHKIANPEGKLGTHRSTELTKVDIITAIGKLDPKEPA